MEGVKLVFALCCIGFIAAKDEKPPTKLPTLDDVAANIEMSVTAEQIALMTISSLVKKNQDDIAHLKEEIERLKPVHPKRHSYPQRETVRIIESDKDFDQEDADGNQFKKVKVMFKKPYSAAPKVLASIQRLDVPKEADHRFEVRVEDVTTKDFILVCLKRGNETVVDYAAISYLSVPSE